MRRGMEVISLWHCSGVREAQVALIARSSALLGLVYLIFLLTILHIFSKGFRSGEFAEQSSTVTPWSLNQLFQPLALWTRAVVKSTFVESKTSPSPKRFESESRPSPKRFESESRPSPKRFESKSGPSPNETVKTEKVKNNLVQNHILNY